MVDDFFEEENMLPIKNFGTRLVKMLLNEAEITNTKVQFYDATDVKVLLKISDKTLYRLRKNGIIPSFKIGKKFYYPQWFFYKLNNKFD